MHADFASLLSETLQTEPGNVLIPFAVVWRALSFSCEEFLRKEAVEPWVPPSQAALGSFRRRWRNTLLCGRSWFHWGGCVQRFPCRINVFDDHFGS